MEWSLSKGNRSFDGEYRAPNPPSSRVLVCYGHHDHSDMQAFTNEVRNQAKRHDSEPVRLQISYIASQNAFFNHVFACPATFSLIFMYCKSFHPSLKSQLRRTQTSSFLLPLFPFSLTFSCFSIAFLSFFSCLIFFFSSNSFKSS